MQTNHNWFGLFGTDIAQVSPNYFCCTSHFLVNAGNVLFGINDASKLLPPSLKLINLFPVFCCFYF